MRKDADASNATNTLESSNKIENRWQSKFMIKGKTKSVKFMVLFLTYLNWCF